MKIPLEEFGGDVPCVPISALKNLNIDDLIETILAQAEVMQLSCDPKGSNIHSAFDVYIDQSLFEKNTSKFWKPT